MLAEVHRQGLRAVFSIEYEYNWERPCRRLPVCEYFDQTAAELAAGAEPPAATAAMSVC